MALEQRAETAANRLFRALVVDLVTRYRSSGDAGLMTYHNRRQPLSLADEFRAIDCVAAGDARAL